MHSALHQQRGTHWPSQFAGHHHVHLLPIRQPCTSNASAKHCTVRPLNCNQQGAISSSGSSRVQQHVSQGSTSTSSSWQQSHQQHPSSSISSSSVRSRVQRQASTRFTPILSASEISRGLTNMDLHLRQHYEEHINWDADKEDSRVWRRTMFTFPDWKRHRSSFRYVHHLQTIFESRIVRGLLRPVMVITSCCVAVAMYHTLHNLQVFPSWVPAMPVIPIEPFQLTSFALSLLLVFRTNSSYSRWNEGRRRFGGITTTCRDILRQILALVPRTNHSCRALMARWLIAFCRASKWYIREDEPLAKELTPWLEPNELKQLVASPHPPNFCILVLSHAVANCGLDQYALVQVQSHLANLSQNLSACDRILNTPIPLSYTRHTARFLVLWLLLLPLSLWGSCGWLMVPIVMIISFVLLGIEEIGVQIEEPFSILALENLCKKAERHISGMMIMDDGCYKLVQQQMGNPHIPSPWHVAMSGFSSSNGTALHSMDGATSSSKKKKKDVD